MHYHYHKNFCWGTFCFLTGINSLLNLLAGSQPCHTGFSSEVQHRPLYQPIHSLRLKENRDLVNFGEVIYLHSTKILRARKTPSAVLYTIPTSPNKNSELASSDQLQQTIWRSKTCRKSLPPFQTFQCLQQQLFQLTSMKPWMECKAEEEQAGDIRKRDTSGLGSSQWAKPVPFTGTKRTLTA